MHSKIIIVSALTAMAVAADPFQLEFPICSGDCIPRLTRSIGCDSSNFACFCAGRNAIAHMLVPCLMQQCTGRDMGTTQELIERRCNTMGIKATKRGVEACPGGNCGYSASSTAAPAPSSSSYPTESHPSPEPAPEEPIVVCPTGGANPCPTYAPTYSPTSAPAPPSNETAPGPEHGPQPPTVQPPVVAGSSSLHVGLGLMGGALVVAGSLL